MLLIVLLFIFIWLPISTILSGALISTFYGWFIAGPGAAFHEQAVHGSIPADISIIQALGISAFISYFLISVTMMLAKSDSDDDGDVRTTMTKTVIKSLLLYATFFVVGFIYHLFM